MTTQLMSPVSQVTADELYRRAERVPYISHFAGDSLGVWEDYFDVLHQKLTSLPMHDIIDSELE